jgi:GTP cyclohydrolase II
MSFSKVEKVADADFPTRWGHFRILGFRGFRGTGTDSGADEDAIAVVMGDLRTTPPLVRIHSQCLTGDVFGSLRCDCRDQLEMALEKIAEAGSGILLYEQKEGRGIGLLPKLMAYELQDQGLDTVEANEQLGFDADQREYEMPAAMLKLMGVTRVKLLSNNPKKVEALEAAGIEVVERVSAEVESRPTTENYMRVKREKMGHLLG